MLILLWIIVLLPCLYKLYFHYLLYILDRISYVTAWLALPFFDKGDIMGYNLRLVGQTPSSDIKFKSLQLFVLNILIALHQRFLSKKDSLLKHYIYEDVPEEFRTDLKNRKCIIALAHYGIFYDFTSLQKHFDILLAPVFKLPTSSERLVFGKVTSIYPINLNLFKNYMTEIYKGQISNNIINKQDIIGIVCDQKGNTKNKPVVEFLGQKVHFHSSPVDIHKVTRRAIWGYFCRYDFDRKKIIMSLVPIKRTRDDTDVQVIMQTMSTTLTKEIIGYPEQYFWKHDRFR
jgi:lauroyl/myristoyl acyltransferase